MTLREASAAESAGGAGGVLQGARGGYVDANVEAKDTERQDIKSDRFGTAEVAPGGGGDGYLVAEPTAKDTTRQETGNSEYYGTGADASGAKAQRSYSDMYAALINELREGTLERPEPTTSGPKVATGKEDIEGSVRLNKRNADVRYDASEMFPAEPLEGKPLAGTDDRVGMLGEHTRQHSHTASTTAALEQSAAALASQLAGNPYALKGPALQQARAVMDDEDDFFEGFS